jgi:hypothetical protein
MPQQLDNLVKACCLHMAFDINRWHVEGFFFCFFFLKALQDLGKYLTLLRKQWFMVCIYMMALHLCRRIEHYTMPSWAPPPCDLVFEVWFDDLYVGLWCVSATLWRDYVLICRCSIACRHGDWISDNVEFLVKIWYNLVLCNRPESHFD